MMTLQQASITTLVASRRVEVGEAKLVMQLGQQIVGIGIPRYLELISRFGRTANLALSMLPDHSGRSEPRCVAIRHFRMTACISKNLIGVAVVQKKHDLKGSSIATK